MPVDLAEELANTMLRCGIHGRKSLEEQNVPNMVVPRSTLGI